MSEKFGKTGARTVLRCIPDETAAKFERLGFGLGLAVADYVMKKHNGMFIISDVRDLAQ